MSEKREITEILTIYKRLKRGKNQYLYQPGVNSFEDFDEGGNKFYDFGQLILENYKFLLYSKETSLLESDEWPLIADRKFFWLNIFNPSDADLEILKNDFDVHDISLNDIREKNTEEKIEVFKHYTFISTKLIGGGVDDIIDIDFNILMFKDYIITTHDKPWPSINDIVNFIALISKHTTIYPDWVFYSIIIEFLQDVKFMMRQVLPEIYKIQAVSTSAHFEISDVLKDNFKLVYRLYDIRNFCKPKIDIISALKTKHSKRMRKNVNHQLLFALSEFNGIDREAREANNVLERCQDLFIALVNLENSREDRAMNKVIHKLTIVTFIFLPLQAVSGLWGMNVKVPFQNTDNVLYFWLLALIGPFFSLMYFLLPVLLNRKKKKYKISDLIY